MNTDQSFLWSVLFYWPSFRKELCAISERKGSADADAALNAGAADGSPIIPSDRAASRRTSLGSFSFRKAEINAAVPARLLI